MAAPGKMGKGQQPVLDRSKASDLNMAVLRRIDPQIEEVRSRCQESAANTQIASLLLLWLVAGVGLP